MLQFQNKNISEKNDVFFFSVRLFVPRMICFNLESESNLQQNMIILVRARLPSDNSTKNYSMKHDKLFGLNNYSFIFNPSL
jgi:hypothetical protein